MPNRVALSLALRDTEACLSALRRHASSIELAEVRLDRMETFDLPRLVKESLCRLVVTCRPPREGGGFDGSEAERLEVLARAWRLGCAYVDVEWDSLEALRAKLNDGRRLLASRHWADGMPASLLPAYEELSGRAEAVKLVGTARSVRDALPVLDLLRRAAGPVVALAMGAAGSPTRLLAPCFENCLLTYGALSTEELTAPGQLTVGEMLNVYRLQSVGPHTAVHVHLCADASRGEAVARRNAGAPGESLHVPVVVNAAEAGAFARGLRSCLPGLSLSADAGLGTAVEDLLSEASFA
jgi:3-dehydroquinate dehydratase/shikimate dehydrogenase